MCFSPKNAEKYICLTASPDASVEVLLQKKTTLAKTGVDDHQGGFLEVNMGVCRGQLHGNCISQSLASKRHSQCLQTVKMMNLFSILVRRLIIMTFACKKL